MASRSGRRGDFSPESKEFIESVMRGDAPLLDDDAAADPAAEKAAKRQPRRALPTPAAAAATSKAAAEARLLTPAKPPPASATCIAVVAGPKTKNVASGVIPSLVEGCKVCHRDSDHPHLLLCEACNDEYHTYCLKPPLQSVPEGDFFCDKCKRIQAAKDDDGLDALVSALPPSYTSRFGEIVWAAGGVGFGWWPACVYDPRLTVGGARQLARKNLGRRHLIYFFECDEAPFTVLGDNRLTRWDDGFLEEYDLGRVARSSGKGRHASFERAVLVARLEHGRPIELRMDWNHQEVLPTPRVARQKPVLPAPSEPPQKKQKPSPSSAVKPPSSAAKPPSSAAKPSTSSASPPQNNSAVNRRNLDAAIGSLGHRGGANAIEPHEDGVLVCKILRRMPSGAECTAATEGIEFSRNLGFVALPSRQGATFAAIRRAVECDLDDDVLPSDEKGGRRRWKFYVPKLGPMSVKQEGKMGPALEFLKSTTDDAQLGNGTACDPLKVVIMDV